MSVRSSWLAKRLGVRPLVEPVGCRVHRARRILRISALLLAPRLLLAASMRMAMAAPAAARASAAAPADGCQSRDSSRLAALAERKSATPPSTLGMSNSLCANMSSVPAIQNRFMPTGMSSSVEFTSVTDQVPCIRVMRLYPQGSAPFATSMTMLGHSRSVMLAVLTSPSVAVLNSASGFVHVSPTRNRTSTPELQSAPCCSDVSTSTTKGLPSSTG
mmetsp:Transcript_14104/g.41996  ORF Transcript_14104/g.41996 Transcript_14104/m.41996 type:complete len:217 (-) Transcript_14104:1030-1680(-)